MADMPQDGLGAFDDFLARYLQGERARQARSFDLTRFLSKRTQEMLQRAGAFALGRGQQELDALHVLRVLLEDETVRAAVARTGGDASALEQAAEERLPAEAAEARADAASLTSAVQRALFHAYQVARRSGSTYIDPEHVFFAFVLNQDRPSGQMLAARRGQPGVAEAGRRPGRRSGQVIGQSDDGMDAESETPMLDAFGHDLTAEAREDLLDPVIGRSDEIDQTIEILARRTKNNPVLVGEAGVGKTAVVEGLARAIVADEVLHSCAAGA